NVDVGMVEIMERNDDRKQVRKRLEVDFVANQGSKRYYIQSAFRMEDEDKVIQEKKSLINVPDSFKKIIIEKDLLASYHDNDGILRIGLFDFLLNPNSLDL
ncbi:MAG: ATP-binding protein, partial [Candidatus Cryptobacteroides sp.]|nr:ATP-binding protein [Candidatus Cryptobacteroides sp.]